MHVSVASRFHDRVRAVAILVCIAFALATNAAEPLVRNVNLRGLQIEGTTTVVVDGDHLAGARLLLPFAAKSELKPDSTDKKATFDVTVPADATPGYCNLRVVTDGGVSLPILIGVDKLPQSATSATVDQLPAALHGVVGGSQVVETKFTGKAGQALTVEVEAQRIDSKLRPVLHLYNAKRRQLDWSWPTPALQGDTRLEATLPADGEYTIALHDMEYGPPGPGYYRLKGGQFAFVDQVFPTVITKGQAVKIEIGPSTPLLIEVAAPTLPGYFPLPLPAGQAWSGPRPFVEISSHAELIEQVPAPEGSQPLPAEQVGVSGKLSTPLEEDRYRLAVTPNAKLRFEVFAERYGSPIDAAIVVRNEKGDLLARGEDGPNTIDPVLDYIVPAQTNAILVGVVDALGRGGPRGIYRLVVTPQSAIKNNFRLTTPIQRLSLANAGRVVVPVFVERDGYDGPVEISVVGLPSGVKLEGTTIPEGRGGTLVTFVREGAGEAAILQLRGKAADGRESLVTVQNVQPGQVRTGPSRIQPWLDQELAAALTTANAADFQIDWKDLPADAGWIPGRKLALPIKLVRPMDPMQNVRLSLVTSQGPQFNNNQLDQNRMLRAEAAVELPPTAAEGQLSVVIPADLPQAAYQVTVQAELLTADKQSVVARAFAPLRDLPARHQLVIQLANSRVEMPLDAKTGAMVKLDGKLERREGLTGDVQLTIAGLPPGVQGNSINVKADAVDFSFVVVFPANFAPGEVKGLRLSANAADNQNGNVRVNSRSVPVTIVLQPPPTQP
jgi:hypothetical protein